jgi:putative Mg2+ transporter-C (MgtC) family protein
LLRAAGPSGGGDASGAREATGPLELAEQLTLLAQVAVAMAIGAVIGIERELAHKPAGLRTHMLVAGAAALMVGIDFAIVRKFGAARDLPLVRVDPAIVIQAVVTAVGFLGAGTILHAARRAATADRGPVHVEGLTTAASLLFVAALGTCVGVGLYWLALGVAALGWLTLRLVSKFERRFRRDLPEDAKHP